MIIRIVGEGQWQVPDTEMGHLNGIVCEWGWILSLFLFRRARL